MIPFQVELTENNLDALFEKVLRYQKSKNEERKGSLVLLTGDMGAGKTTFVRKFVNSVSLGQYPNSPTYNLHNIYDSKNGQIHHFDLYRLNSDIEAVDLGFLEIWGNKDLSFVEWWQKFPDLFSALPSLQIEIRTLSLETRVYEVSQFEPTF